MTRSMRPTIPLICLSSQNWWVEAYWATRAGHKGIKANDYRLVALVQFKDGVLTIRFFGSHEEYDDIDAETV
jgi:mRNA-degrading endonuclease HigB of HigAB toxin-antitoxin module